MDGGCRHLQYEGGFDEYMPSNSHTNVGKRAVATSMCKTSYSCDYDRSMKHHKVNATVGYHTV